MKYPWESEESENVLVRFLHETWVWQQIGSICYHGYVRNPWNGNLELHCVIVWSSCSEHAASNAIQQPPDVVWVESPASSVSGTTKAVCSIGDAAEDAHAAEDV